MKSRMILLCVALAGTVAVIVWLRRPEVEVEAPVPVQPQMTRDQGDTAKPEVQQAAPPATQAKPPTVVRRADVVRPADSGPLHDADGHLIMQVRVRDEIERLLSSNPGNLEQAKRELVASLPPVAAQEMLELVRQFGEYRTALRQTLPESPQAMSQQDALTMLQTVHALRVTYFGEELTEIFFGAEEEMARNMAEGKVN